MILEETMLRLRKNMDKAFEESFREVTSIMSSMNGYI